MNEITNMPKLSNKEKIFISCEKTLTRIAICHQGQLEYLFVEKEELQALAGNIYKGKVSRTLRGLNAAFVNIGEGKNGFLPFDEHESIYSEEVSEKDGGIQDAFVSCKEGDDIIVQLTKPSSQFKGPKLTTHISIPGRFVVLLANSSQRTISRKIKSSREKRRLVEIFNNLVPDKIGFIIRTASEHQRKELVTKETRYLLNLWGKIRRAGKRASAPSKLWQELELPTRVLRNYVDENIEVIYTDDAQSFKKVRSYVKSYIPGALRKVYLYKEKVPLFTNFGIDTQIVKFVKSKVSLPSGGYLFGSISCFSPADADGKSRLGR